MKKIINIFAILSVLCVLLGYNTHPIMAHDFANAPIISLKNAVITDTYILDSITVTEGYIPFREFQTHFRIAGDLNSTKPPLLLLHGGPGSTHNYFEVLDHLATDTNRLLR